MMRLRHEQVLKDVEADTGHGGKAERELHVARGKDGAASPRPGPDLEEAFAHDGENSRQEISQRSKYTGATPSPSRAGRDQEVLAWLRRIIVSLGIGGASYAIMLAIMVLSVVYDQQFEPVITFAFDTGRWITDVLDSWVSGSRWAQVAVNHLRERVNMTHVVLSIPAIILATIFVGIPLNKFLGGTRSALQRVAMAVVSVPTTVILAVALFTFNALVPDTYAALLRFADWIWQGSLNALSASGDTIPGARKLTNIARQGFSGHHYVIMALCSTLAAFLVNMLFALATKPRSENHEASRPVRTENH